MLQVQNLRCQHYLSSLSFVHVCAYLVCSVDRKKLNYHWVLVPLKENINLAAYRKGA